MKKFIIALALLFSAPVLAADYPYLDQAPPQYSEAEVQAVEKLPRVIVENSVFYLTRSYAMATTVNKCRHLYSNLIVVPVDSVQSWNFEMMQQTLLEGLSPDAVSAIRKRVFEKAREYVAAIGEHEPIRNHQLKSRDAWCQWRARPVVDASLEVFNDPRYPDYIEAKAEYTAALQALERTSRRLD